MDVFRPIPTLFRLDFEEENFAEGTADDEDSLDKEVGEGDGDSIALHLIRGHTQYLKREASSNSGVFGTAEGEIRK